MENFGSTVNAFWSQNKYWFLRDQLGNSSFTKYLKGRTDFGSCFFLPWSLGTQQNNSAPQNPWFFRVGSNHCTVGTLWHQGRKMNSRHLSWPCLLNPVFDLYYWALAHSMYSLISGSQNSSPLHSTDSWSGPAHASNCLLNPSVWETWLSGSAQDNIVLSWWLSKIIAILSTCQLLF